MRYKLKLREITESDTGIECPFVPDPDDYQIYVRAFVHDLNEIDIVFRAHQDNNSVIIELINNSTCEQLRKSIITITQSYWEKLRVTQLEKIE